MDFVRLGRTAMLALVVGLPGCAAPPADVGGVYLNDLQMLGSHNSYKLAMQPEKMAALVAVNPELARQLDYAHAPLEEQLDLGLRKLELDVFYDPTGERYGPGSPGFRVQHVQNLDDRSDCPSLTACLSRLRAWSLGHPGHLPIAVSINAKDEIIDQPGFVEPLPFDGPAWAWIDRIIETVLGDRLIRPAAVLTGGPPQWPQVDAARNRFLFVLDEGGRKRDAYAERWSERVMFTTVSPPHPGAGFLIVNDPIADFDRIQALVRAGYLVRTRADADTLEARRNDTARRTAAFTSGAQYVSTDYYRADPRFSGYMVVLPGGGAARCNPVRQTPACMRQY